MRPHKKTERSGKKVIIINRALRSLLYKLLEAYSEETDMSDKLKEFVRQTMAEMVKKLPPEERLKGLSVDDLRQQLTVAQRLEGLSAEDVLRALPPETLQALTRQFKANGSSAKPQ